MLALNFFSMAALIGVIFMLVIGLFLVSVKDKSASTNHLMLLHFSMVIFFGAYTFAAILYDSIGVYHRWVTVFIVFIALSEGAQFFFRFPENNNRKLANIFLIVQSLLAVAFTLLFIYKTHSAPRIYHFDGHYWDYDAEGVSRLIGVFIFIYYIILNVVGFTRFVRIKSKERWTLLFMLLPFSISMITPIVLNILSRAGQMDRGTYQISFVLFLLLGFFVVVIVYINSTRERTTFMVKIIGITLVTFLVVFQWLTYVFRAEINDAYNRIYQEYTLHAVEGDFHDELAYLIRYRCTGETDVDNILTDQSIEVIKKKTDIALPVKKVVPELMNSFVYSQLADLQPELRPTFFRHRISGILQNCPNSFAGYKNLLLDKMSRISSKESLTSNIKSEMLAYLQEINTKVSVHRKAISSLPKENFKKYLESYIKGMDDPDMLPFQKIIHGLLNDKAKGEQLRKKVLFYMTPALAPEERRYRQEEWAEDKLKAQHYVSFVYFEPEKKELYEAGFSYVAYREYIHRGNMPHFWILLFVLFIILFIFPLFFRSGMVLPLRRLLHGVRSIDEGQLKVYVKPKVQDEIGYLSNTFNLMARTIRESSRKLHDYAQNLEEKVEARTNELRQSLEEVNTLKLQQDGDYFLTSLLIKPLGSNEVQSDEINIDFYVRQKKTFQFRQWDTEIGGDICIAHKIPLYGKEFVAFVNGDAMGKSIQGAGGALVLGVVFRAMVSRTQMVKQEQRRYPEQWLKDAFNELQKVFESFDGSMLISVVMGLIDEKTGLMYYMNAEHPWTVLYREDKVAFIEKELMLHKIGTTGLGGNLRIRTFQLKPGDVVIAGSDGRDDIILDEDDYGQRVINEDEKEFLHRVKEGEGDLNQIVAYIDNQGKLSDDLSLLRIGYREQAQALGQEEALEAEWLERFRQGSRLLEEGDYGQAEALLKEVYDHEPNYAPVLRDLARIYLKQRDYEKAAYYCDAYIMKSPHDIRFIYYASMAFKKTRQLERAADLGERVRLRSPHIVENLLNLGDVYRLLGNIPRAQMMLELALEQSPNDPSAIKLQNALRQGQGVAI